MKQIRLVQMQLRAFRSFLTTTIVDLAGKAGLTLFAGRNEAEPRLGANGAGKSTVWDGVCWILYGTSIRGLRTAELVSYGKDKAAGWLQLDIDGQIQTVHRSGPPNRLFIDGTAVEQAEVDRLVGRSRSRFLNSVIFGQAVPLFIDLPIPQRGDLLDEVLDLEVWLRAADHAAMLVKRQDSELATLTTAIARLQGRLEGLPDLADLSQLAENWASDRADRLRALIARYDAANAELQAIPADVAVSSGPVDQARDRHRQQVERSGILQRQAAVLRADIAKLQKDIQFFADNAVCPVCNQDIAEAFRQEHRDELVADLAEQTNRLTDLQNRIRKSIEREASLEATLEAARGRLMLAEGERRANDTRRVAKRAESDDLQRQAIRCRNEKNPYDDQRRQVAEQKQQISAELAVKRRDETALVNRLAGLNYWRGGFRKVRLFCLENVLVELSAETRNSLMALGLLDWQIAFKTATETRSGTVKLGVQVDVQPPSRAGGRFDVLSGGEGQRARLAGSLGLANLIQRWSGVRFGFEIWDEPTAFLSDQGIDDLLDCLAERARLTDRQIFVCDHRALQAGVFDQVVTVVKDGAGSRIEHVA